MTELEQLQAYKVMAQAIRLATVGKELLALIDSPHLREIIDAFERDLAAFTALHGKSHDEGLRVLQSAIAQG